VTGLRRLRIAGGTLYDPATGVDGEARDVCIEDGRIVANVPADAPTLDARGMVVMAGGVDMHAHIAGSAVNQARRLLAEEHSADPAPAPALDHVDDSEPLARSGTGGTLPTTFTTGYRYAGLGYTTVFDAAVAPLLARSTHAELDDTPIVDAGAFILMGNDEYLFRLIDAGERERARDYTAWVLGAAGGYAIKVVNPGGVERWKSGGRNVTGLDDPVGSSRVTPRAILETLADAANALALPHAAHVHCNNLGIPGNVRTTLETMRAVAGRRCHFTHLQFHSYGGEVGGAWRSAAREVAEYVNAHPEVSADVGQVMFGPATTLTADAPVEYLLHKSSGRRWTNVDVELETGCGIVPYSYKERAAVAALQWAVGLELFLLAADPWRMVLSTDHPNGGSFRSYPELIRLLMDRAYRDEQLKRANPKLLAGSTLAEGMAREYTLNEIAIVTRAGPARLLGLTSKGHLGVGADADVTVYAPAENVAEMFATPRFVVKGGTLVVEEGELRRAPSGRRLHVRPAYDGGVERDIERFFDAYATVSFENYPVRGLRDDPVPVGAPGGLADAYRQGRREGHAARPASGSPALDAGRGAPPHRESIGDPGADRQRDIAAQSESSGDAAPGRG
jgi:formylmethanofuran dehydrogenase subunit A